MIWIGLFMVVAGAWVATQSTQSKMPGPFVAGGFVLIIVWLFT